MRRLALVIICLPLWGCGGNDPPPNPTAVSAKTKTATEEPKFRGHPMRFWIEKLQDRDDDLRGWAIRTVGEIGPAAKETVPLLRKALKEETRTEMRMWTAQALGRIGPDAKEAVPELAAALKDQESTVRLHAAEALGEIGAKDALAPLQEALKHADDELREVLVKSIEKVKTGSEAPEAKPAKASADRS